MKYFISYTAHDKEITKPFLQSISDKLAVFGSVYIDILNNDSIDKQARVFNELDNCDLVILIETDNVYKSKWVQIEIERATRLDKPVKKIPFTKLASSLIGQL